MLPPCCRWCVGMVASSHRSTAWMRGLDGRRLRGPAGAEAHGGVVLVHLLPEGEGEVGLQVLHQLVGEDGVLLVGGES